MQIGLHYPNSKESSPREERDHNVLEIGNEQWKHVMNIPLRSCLQWFTKYENCTARLSLETLMHAPSEKRSTLSPPSFACNLPLSEYENLKCKASPRAKLFLAR